MRRPAFKKRDKEVFRGWLWNLYLDMFGNLFKRLVPGRAEGWASQMRFPWVKMGLTFKITLLF
jgi:hypothetical protein